MNTIIIFSLVIALCALVLSFIFYFISKRQNSNYGELSDRRSKKRKLDFSDVEKIKWREVERNKFRELDPSLPSREIFHPQPDNVRFVGRYKPVEPFFSKEQIHALYTVLKGEPGVYLKWASGVLFFVKRNEIGDAIELFPWQEKDVDKLNLFLKTPIKPNEYEEFIERKCKELLEGRIIAPLPLKEKKSNSTNAPSYNRTNIFPSIADSFSGHARLRADEKYWKLMDEYVASRAPSDNGIHTQEFYIDNTTFNKPDDPITFGGGTFEGGGSGSSYDDSSSSGSNDSSSSSSDSSDGGD